LGLITTKKVTAFAILAKSTLTETQQLICFNLQLLSDLKPLHTPYRNLASSNLSCWLKERSFSHLKTTTLEIFTFF